MKAATQMKSRAIIIIGAYFYAQLLGMITSAIGMAEASEAAEKKAAAARP